MQAFYNKIAKLNEIAAKGGEDAKLAAAGYYVLEAKEMLKQAKTPPAAVTDDAVEANRRKPRRLPKSRNSVAR